MLSIHPRTHILELTKDREIHITQEQYRALKIAQKISSYNESLEIRDPDTWKILHDWLWKDFAWFREIERSSNGQDRYVCDFSTRHPMQEICDCSNKYNIPPVLFREKMNQLFPHRYAITLSAQEKNTILSYFK